MNDAGDLDGEALTRKLLTGHYGEEAASVEERPQMRHKFRTTLAQHHTAIKVAGVLGVLAMYASRSGPVSRFFLFH